MNESVDFLTLRFRSLEKQASTRLIGEYDEKILGLGRIGKRKKRKIGPSISSRPDIDIGKRKKPAAFDPDAVDADRDNRVQEGTTAERVVTPRPGVMARLLGRAADRLDVTGQREGRVQRRERRSRLAGAADRMADRLDFTGQEEGRVRRRSGRGFLPNMLDRAADRLDNTGRRERAAQLPDTNVEEPDVPDATVESPTRSAGRARRERPILRREVLRDRKRADERARRRATERNERHAVFRDEDANGFAVVGGDERIGQARERYGEPLAEFKPDGKPIEEPKPVDVVPKPVEDVPERPVAELPGNVVGRHRKGERRRAYAHARRLAERDNRRYAVVRAADGDGYEVVDETRAIGIEKYDPERRVHYVKPRRRPRSEPRREEPAQSVPRADAPDEVDGPDANVPDDRIIEDLRQRSDYGKQRAQVDGPGGAEYRAGLTPDVLNRQLADRKKDRDNNIRDGRLDDAAANQAVIDVFEDEIRRRKEGGEWGQPDSEDSAEAERIAALRDEESYLQIYENLARPELAQYWRGGDTETLKRQVAGSVRARDAYLRDNDIVRAAHQQAAIDRYSEELARRQLDVRAPDAEETLTTAHLTALRKENDYSEEYERLGQPAMFEYRQGLDDATIEDHANRLRQMRDSLLEADNVGAAAIAQATIDRYKEELERRRAPNGGEALVPLPNDPSVKTEQRLAKGSADLRQRVKDALKRRQNIVGRFMRDRWGGEKPWLLGEGSRNISTDELRSLINASREGDAEATATIERWARDIYELPTFTGAKGIQFRTKVTVVEPTWADQMVVRGKIEGKLPNGEWADVGTFSRQLYPANKRVYNATLFINGGEDYKKGGFATTFNLHAFTWLKNSGFEAAGVSAADDGPYVWGRFGYVDRENAFRMEGMVRNFEPEVRAFRGGRQSIIKSEAEARRIEYLLNVARNNPDDVTHMDWAIAMETDTDDRTREVNRWFRNNVPFGSGEFSFDRIVDDPTLDLPDRDPSVQPAPIPEAPALSTGERSWNDAQDRYDREAEKRIELRRNPAYERERAGIGSEAVAYWEQRVDEGVDEEGIDILLEQQRHFQKIAVADDAEFPRLAGVEPTPEMRARYLANADWFGEMHRRLQNRVDDETVAELRRDSGYDAVRQDQLDDMLIGLGDPRDRLLMLQDERARALRANNRRGAAGLQRRIDWLEENINGANNPEAPPAPQVPSVPQGVERDLNAAGEDLRQRMLNAVQKRQRILRRFVDRRWGEDQSPWRVGEGGLNIDVEELKGLHAAARGGDQEARNRLDRWVRDIYELPEFEGANGIKFKTELNGIGYWRDGQIQVSGLIWGKLPDGEWTRIGHLSRKIDIDRKFVYNNVLKIEERFEAYKKGGLATTYNLHAFTWLKNAGFKEAKVQSAWDGPYVWGRFGYVPSNNRAAMQRVARKFERELAGYRAGRQSVIKNDNEAARIEYLLGKTANWPERGQPRLITHMDWIMALDDEGTARQKELKRWFTNNAPLNAGKFSFNGILDEPRLEPDDANLPNAGRRARRVRAAGAANGRQPGARIGRYANERRAEAAARRRLAANPNEVYGIHRTDGGRVEVVNAQRADALEAAGRDVRRIGNTPSAPRTAPEPSPATTPPRAPSPVDRTPENQALADLGALADNNRRMLDMMRRPGGVEQVEQGLRERDAYADQRRGVDTTEYRRFLEQNASEWQRRMMLLDRWQNRRNEAFEAGEDPSRTAAQREQWMDRAAGAQAHIDRIQEFGQEINRAEPVVSAPRRSTPDVTPEPASVPEPSSAPKPSSDSSSRPVDLNAVYARRLRNDPAYQRHFDGELAALGDPNRQDERGDEQREADAVVAQLFAIERRNRWMEEADRLRDLNGDAEQIQRLERNALKEQARHDAREQILAQRRRALGQPESVDYQAVDDAIAKRLRAAEGYRKISSDPVWDFENDVDELQRGLQNKRRNRTEALQRNDEFAAVNWQRGIDYLERRIAEIEGSKRKDHELLVAAIRRFDEADVRRKTKPIGKSERRWIDRGEIGERRPIGERLDGVGMLGEIDERGIVGVRVVTDHPEIKSEDDAIRWVADGKNLAEVPDDFLYAALEGNATQNPLDRSKKYILQTGDSIAGPRLFFAREVIGLAEDGSPVYGDPTGQGYIVKPPDPASFVEDRANVAELMGQYMAQEFGFVAVGGRRDGLIDVTNRDGTQVRGHSVVLELAPNIGVGDFEDSYESIYAHQSEEAVAERLDHVLFNGIIGALDRHPGNGMILDGHPMAVDYGRAFLPGHQGPYELAGRPIPYAGYALPDHWMDYLEDQMLAAQQGMFGPEPAFDDALVDELQNLPGGRAAQEQFIRRRLERAVEASRRALDNWDDWAAQVEGAIRPGDEALNADELPRWRMIVETHANMIEANYDRIIERLLDM